MSGAEDDRAMLAAEYALGSLDLADMRQAEALAAADPAFAREVQEWAQRLGPLAFAVLPVEPPAALWSRLALATGVAAAPPRRSSGGLWKATTGVSLAIAAGLALFAFLPRPPSADVEPGRFAAALAPLGTPARFLAMTGPDGTMTLTSLNNPAAPAGRSLQLWSLPQGASVPVSLGLLSSGQQVIHPPKRGEANEQLLVSDEPVGGSPTGAPTGAVLFGGTLVPLSPVAKPGQ